jgi:ribosomal protein S18 acetylase RimI-like enzyme
VGGAPSNGASGSSATEGDRAALALRRGERADRPYIIGLARDSFARFGDYGEIIARWLDASGAVSVVARATGDRIGFAIVAPHRRFGIFRPRFAELVAIAVDPGHRARGVGRCLLERAELVARTWDAGEVRLHTACDNRIAQEFFSAAGYRRIAAAPSYYPNGQEALEMARPLR